MFFVKQQKFYQHLKQQKEKQNKQKQKVGKRSTGGGCCFINPFFIIKIKNKTILNVM